MLNTTKGKYQKNNTTYTDVSSPETSGDSKQIVNIFEDDGIFKYQLEDSEIEKEIRVNFDVIIKTQTEFENLIASPTWLDARSVLFDGTNGFFTKHSNSGISVPNNVIEIYGINNATISVSGFIYSETPTNPSALFSIYEFNNARCIYGLSVWCSADDTSTQASAIYGMTKLVNCTAKCEGDIANTYAFNNCKRLLNCTGHSQYVFNNFYGNHIGFYNCKQLTNCNAWANGNNSFGYVNCDNGSCNTVELLSMVTNYNCEKWDSETNDTNVSYIVSKKILLWSGNEPFVPAYSETANLELYYAYELAEGDILEIHCNIGSTAYSYIFTGKVTSTGSALTFKGNVIFGNSAMNRLVAECEFSNLGTLKVIDLVAIENFDGTGTSLSGVVTKVYKILE